MSDFWKQNEAWEKQAREEFADDYPSVARDADRIEVCENGDVVAHFEGSAYPFIYRNAVTPFEEEISK